MAYLELRNGTKKSIGKERGMKLWEGLQNPELLDDVQVTYLRSVKKLYLNWRSAPDSYVEANLEDVVPMALDDWLVDKQGHTTRPGSSWAWDFARKWGLWTLGSPTRLTRQHTIVAEAFMTPLSVVDYSEAAKAD